MGVIKVWKEYKLSKSNQFRNYKNFMKLGNSFTHFLETIVKDLTKFQEEFIEINVGDLKIYTSWTNHLLWALSSYQNPFI